MILIDTSAWIEFLRNTGSTVCKIVDDLLGDDIAICDAISMEVLAGARDERHLGELQRLLARATMISITPADYEQATEFYRVCRRNGETIRKLIDCLIAAVAVRVGVPLLHADADFAALARHTRLAIYSAELG